jgi:hypothetical protein
LTKVGKVPPELLSPLPQCTEPNQRVHADLFGPLKCPNGDKKFIWLQIVVNVARVKCYFGATSFSDDTESSIVPNSNVPTDNNLPNGKNLLADPPQSVNPCALTAAHSRVPGCPRKVLSPASPDVSFSKKGGKRIVMTLSRKMKLVFYLHLRQ